MKNYHNDRYAVAAYRSEPEVVKQQPLYKGRKKKRPTSRGKLRAERNEIRATIHVHATRLLTSDFPLEEIPIVWKWRTNYTFTGKDRRPYKRGREQFAVNDLGHEYSREDWDNVCRYYEAKAAVALREIVPPAIMNQKRYW